MNATGRAGSENVPAIVGLGTAADLAKQEQAPYAEHLSRLTHRLREGLNAHIDRLHYNGHPDHCAPGTLNVSFESVEGESLILRLDMEGICVSTGSACTSGSMEPSHVLAALGLPPRLAQGTVRFSSPSAETQPKPKSMPLLPSYRKSSSRCGLYIEDKLLVCRNLKG